MRGLKLFRLRSPSLRHSDTVLRGFPHQNVSRRPGVFLKPSAPPCLAGRHVFKKVKKHTIQRTGPGERAHEEFIVARTNSSLPFRRPLLPVAENRAPGTGHGTRRALHAAKQSKKFAGHSPCKESSGQLSRRFAVPRSGPVCVWGGRGPPPTLFFAPRLDPGLRAC